MKPIWKLLRQTISQWLTDRAFQLAGSLSFFSIISLAPLATVILSIASLFYGEQAVRGNLVTHIQNFVGSPGAEVIQSVLANAHQSKPGIFDFISIVMLLVGASAVFIQLQIALNTVWNVTPRSDLPWWHTIKRRLFSMGLVIMTGILLFLLTIITALVSGLASQLQNIVPGFLNVWPYINLLLGFIAGSTLFTALFKFVPDAVIRFRDAGVGGMVTALLFEIGRLAIGFYLGRSAPGSAYGAAGSLIAVLIWIDYSALILLWGAEFTQVYASRYGERIHPAEHAWRTSQTVIPVDENGNPILNAFVRKNIQKKTI